jgi:hypothetical protein
MPQKYKRVRLCSLDAVLAALKKTAAKGNGGRAGPAAA